MSKKLFLSSVALVAFFMSSKTEAGMVPFVEKIYNIKVTLRESKYLTYTVSGNLNLQNTPEETLDVFMSILVPAYKGKSSKFYQLTVNK